MTGMVLGSVGTPLSPWHAAQGCAFVSISSAACTCAMATARPIPSPKIPEKKRVNMTIFPPLCLLHGSDHRVCKQSRSPAATQVWQDAVVFIRRGEHHASQSDVDTCRHRRRDGLSTGH